MWTQYLGFPSGNKWTSVENTQDAQRSLKPALQSNRMPPASDFKSKFKTEMCRNWENGFCPHESRCAFAHGKGELKTKLHIPPNYKTKKCSHFFELGFCLYGQRCQFSHQVLTAPSTPEARQKSPVDTKRLPVFIELENKLI